MIQHRTGIRVRYPDTDKMAVVYHAVYVEYMETGRTEMLRELGMANSAIEAAGLLIPVLEVHMKLLSPARYDEIVTVVSTMDVPTGARFRIDYEIFRDERLLVTGHTVHAFTTVDFRPVRPPASFIDILKEKSQV